MQVVKCMCLALKAHSTNNQGNINLYYITMKKRQTLALNSIFLDIPYCVIAVM